MASVNRADDVQLAFTKILDGLPGAEGPVFDRNGNFFMVAPEVMRNDEFSGQIFKVDLSSQKVDCLVCTVYV